MAVRSIKKETLIPILLVVILAAVGVYFWNKQKNVLHTTSTENSYQELTKRIRVPAELPEITVVTHKESLPEQEFFQNVENGDHIFLFRQSKKAIVYRPSIKKIVAVSSIIESGKSE